VQRDTQVFVLEGPRYQGRDEFSEGQVADIADYAEKQQALEQRLGGLERELERGQAGTQDVQGDMKAVVNDVRFCVQRCELLLQLPLIRDAVKHFQRSVEANAILHDRWQVAGSGKRSPDVPAAADLGGAPLGESQSSPDLRQGGGAASARAAVTAAKAKGSPGMPSQPGRKPFRSVEDWGKPHTPMQCDPVPVRASGPEATPSSTYLPTKPGKSG